MRGRWKSMALPVGLEWQSLAANRTRAHGTRTRGMESVTGPNRLADVESASSKRVRNTAR